MKRVHEEGAMNKPPILSDEQVRQWLCQNFGDDNYILVSNSDSKEAQRDADIAWLREEVEKAELSDKEIREAVKQAHYSLYPLDVGVEFGQGELNPLPPEVELKHYNKAIVKAQLQKILALLRGDAEGV